MAEVNLKHIEKIYPNSGKHKKNNLKVSEEGVHAVQDFNLDVKDEEFVVLVGPSGCGKSTTLRMVAGLEEITRGELYIDGKLMNDVAPKDRDIAMVFQSYALYPHMTVYENMAFPLKIRKMPKDQIDQKVREAAEILGITEYLDRKPKALSGGQRQRVAIGRAIVREPKVLLMDEPLSNLDAKLRNQMRAELIQLRYRIHTTFMYVTHDQIEAMTLGDRIVVMKDGVIQQVGTPQFVFSEPVNTFVATFIGTPQMNMYNGQLKKIDAAHYSVVLDGMEVALTDEKSQHLAEHQVESKDVTIGIRPQHMMLSEKEGLPGHVTVREMMGSEINLHVTIAGSDSIMIIPTTDPNKASTSGFVIGDDIHVTFGGNLVHVFDPETGKNLEY